MKQEDYFKTSELLLPSLLHRVDSQEARTRPTKVLQNDFTTLGDEFS